MSEHQLEVVDQQRPPDGPSVGARPVEPPFGITSSGDPTVRMPVSDTLWRFPSAPTEVGARRGTPLVPRPEAWVGEFTSFSVGNPGNAADIAGVPAREDWDRRDTVVDGFTHRISRNGPGMDLRAASVRGRSHRFAGTVRQDAYGYRITDDGHHLVVTVADGVSSGKLSHFAAEIVTRNGCLEVAKQLADRPADEVDWGAVLHEVNHLLAARGPARVAQAFPGVSVSTFEELADYLASTALFAVVTLEPGPRGLPVDVFAYGDSSAWVLRDGQHWEAQQAVKNEGAAIASSATKALPIPPRSVPPAVHTTLGPGDALVLMSDGVGDPLGDGTGPVGAFLAENWARPPHQLAFAAHVDFARKTFDDDRTAVAVWPVRPVRPVPPRTRHGR